MLPSMRSGAIIQLVRATKAASATSSTGTGRSRLPLARWHRLTVLRHPGGESGLLTPTKSSKTSTRPCKCAILQGLLQLTPKLSRELIKHLWCYLSPSGRIQPEVAKELIRALQDSLMVPIPCRRGATRAPTSTTTAMMLRTTMSGIIHRPHAG
jgi:hypothetical protein